MNWVDIQSWCDDLSAWIRELGEEEELKVAFPKGVLPLKADPEQDDIEEDKDILAYLTVWMCCKRKMRAPGYLESRIILSEKFKGPWQDLYVRLIRRFENNLDYRDIDIFSLAS